MLQRCSIKSDFNKEEEQKGRDKSKLGGKEKEGNPTTRDNKIRGVKRCDQQRGREEK